MTFSQCLALLRFALERAYRRQSRETDKRSTGLHFLLPVPLPERLILLCRLDGASPKAIKTLLKASDEDVALASERMRQAVAQLSAALNDPFAHLIEEPDRNHLRPAETQLQQLLFPFVLRSASRPAFSSIWTLANQAA